MSEQSDTLDTSNARKKRTLLTPEQRRARSQQLFLKSYRETANIKASCKAANIARQTFYIWRDTDTAFMALLPDAEQDANDTLEQAVQERAIKGVESYVVSQGKMVYDPDGKPLVERKYSDTLAVVLLKARMPEKYNKQQIEVTGKDGGPIKVDYSQYSTEELATLEQLALRGIHGNS